MTKSKSKAITITHLYPREMNIYGDTGNVKCLAWRLRRRGYEPVILACGIGDAVPKETDILVTGGGQDSGQSKVQADLTKKGSALKAMVQDGLVVLSICGTYQLFGHYFKTASDDRIEGIGLFDAYTEAGKSRLIGNMVADSPFGRLVGFENHSGRTILADGQLPLAKVIKGFGNDGASGREGAVTLNAFGSYLHGPIIPKNPHLADELLRRAVERRYGKTELEPLDDSLALKAALIAAKRP